MENKCYKLNLPISFSLSLIEQFFSSTEPFATVISIPTIDEICFKLFGFWRRLLRNSPCLKCCKCINEFFKIYLDFSLEKIVKNVNFVEKNIELIKNYHGIPIGLYHYAMHYNNWLHCPTMRKYVAKCEGFKWLKLKKFIRYLISKKVKKVEIKKLYF